MIWAFSYHIKMVLARLKFLTLRVRITVFVMTMALMRTKHGCMGLVLCDWFFITGYIPG